MNYKNIAIASDHAGFFLKKELLVFLEKNNYSTKDYGTKSPDSCDYPDYVHSLANAMDKGIHDFGIIICGSGNGVSMTANKHQKVRSALCWNDNIAALARSHNNANILALPARFITIPEAILITKTFLTTPFDGGRHQTRIDKIPLK